MAGEVVKSFYGHINKREYHETIDLLADNVVYHDMIYD